MLDSELIRKAQEIESVEKQMRLSYEEQVRALTSQTYGKPQLSINWRTQ